VSREFTCSGGNDVRSTSKGREFGPRETAKRVKVYSVDSSGYPSHNDLQMLGNIRERSGADIHKQRLGIGLWLWRDSQ
jgi:hypothetical protein